MVCEQAVSKCLTAEQLLHLPDWMVCGNRVVQTL
jgi:hypothetical protein